MDVMIKETTEYQPNFFLGKFYPININASFLVLVEYLGRWEVCGSMSKIC